MAVQAKALGLVDKIMTSDEYLESICREHKIIEIIEKQRKKVWLALHTTMTCTVKVAIEEMASPLPSHGYTMAVAMPHNTCNVIA